MKILWLLILCILFSKDLYSQELEARAYANLPKDMNGVAFAYAFTRGHVLANPVLPIEDFNVSTHNLATRYVHTFGLFKKLTRVSAEIPFTFMEGRLKFNGQDTSGTRTGIGDTRIQFGINLIGSPALSRKDFIKYTQKIIVGISLTTSIPTGVYYADKTVNIGGNRWGFKPEIGASKRFEHVYADGYIGTWFFTNNSSYQTSKVLKQDPLLSTQLHGVYYFKNQMLVGLDGNWFSGGKTYIDNTQNGDKINHWRLGATWATPIAKKHLVKLQFHFTLHANKGYNYKLIAIGYQYIFF